MRVHLRMACHLEKSSSLMKRFSRRISSGLAGRIFGGVAKFSCRRGKEICFAPKDVHFVTSPLVFNADSFYNIS
jgi:hypothetical protein